MNNSISTPEPRTALNIGRQILEQLGVGGDTSEGPDEQFLSHPTNLLLGVAVGRWFAEVGLERRVVADAVLQVALYVVGDIGQLHKFADR